MEFKNAAQITSNSQQIMTIEWNTGELFLRGGKEAERNVWNGFEVSHGIVNVVIFIFSG